MAFVETKGSFVLFSPMFYLIIQEREYKISFNNSDEMIPLVLTCFLFFFIASFYYTLLLQRILILITAR